MEGSEAARRPIDGKLVGFGIALLVLLVYTRAVSCGWVAFDDLQHVLVNPVVRHGVQFDAIVRAFTTSPASLWIPVTWLSFMLETTVFGTQPWGFHLVNVCLHAANAVLVWRFFESVTGRRWPSVLVAALFAVHPLNVESVAWVTERKNTLSTLFWLLSLQAWLRYGRGGGRRSYLACLGLFVLGGMAKPMIVTLPGTLLLLDAWPLGRFSKLPWTKLLLEKVPFALASLGFTAATIAAHAGSRSLASAETLPVADRLLNVLSSYGIYLQQMIWPANLSILYRHPLDVDAATAVIGAVLLVALSCLAWRTRHRRPEFLWGWLWYLITLLPVVGFFATGSEASADRFTYVPLLGLFLAISVAVADLGRRALAPTIAVLLVLCFITVQQIGVWRDSFSLFRRVTEVNPTSYRAAAMMAYMLGHIREYAAAEQFYRKAIELNPGSAVAWDGLGGALQRLGRTPEAIDAVRKALELDPRQIVSRGNLATALEAVGNDADAEAEWRTVLAQNPNVAVARLRLGKLLAKRGAREEALKELTAAAAIDPAGEEIRSALATLQEMESR